MSLMRGNRYYREAMDSFCGPSSSMGHQNATRLTSELTRALVIEQRTANFIAALSGDDVLVLPGERAKAVAEVRRALGLPEVAEPEIVEDDEDIETD